MQETKTHSMIHCADNIFSAMITFSCHGGTAVHLCSFLNWLLVKYQSCISWSQSVNTSLFLRTALSPAATSTRHDQMQSCSAFKEKVLPCGFEQRMSCPADVFEQLVPGRKLVATNAALDSTSIRRLSLFLPLCFTSLGDLLLRFILSLRWPVSSLRQWISRNLT